MHTVYCQWQVEYYSQAALIQYTGEHCLQGRQTVKHKSYSTYYKPMGDLPCISSEQGGLIIRTENIPYISVLYLYKNFELKRGWAYNTSWAYNTYYTYMHN